MNRFDLVIFDCDGVLVDSERLAVRTEATILAGLGWPLTESEIVDRFVGRSARYMHEQVEHHVGRTVDWEVEFECHYRRVFESELVPVPGLVEALDAITASSCVASSGSHEKMGIHPWDLRPSRAVPGPNLQRRRGRTGKARTGHLPTRRRPHGHPARRCAVVEDSVSGVERGACRRYDLFCICRGCHRGRSVVNGGSDRVRRDAGSSGDPRPVAGRRDPSCTGGSVSAPTLDAEQAFPGGEKLDG